MNKISRRFAFVVGLNFKFGIYSISQVSGRFKKILKKCIFTFRSIFAILINYL